MILNLALDLEPPWGTFCMYDILLLYVFLTQSTPNFKNQAVKEGLT
jgi:hypothetical protein